jgi:hypothetical protein
MLVGNCEKDAITARLSAVIEEATRRLDRIDSHDEDFIDVRAILAKAVPTQGESE